MAIQRAPVSGYTFSVVGDGTATVVTVDLANFIACDNSLHNKNPTAILSLSMVTGAAPTSYSIAGTVVTLTWGSAIAANTVYTITVVPLFSA